MILLDTLKSESPALAAFLTFKPWNAQYTPDQIRYQIEIEADPRGFHPFFIRWRENASELGLKFKLTDEATSILGF